ncbi:aldehyde ferredoxin oxidoreductase family protein, partial [Chloroflexota bacterium]
FQGGFTGKIIEVDLSSLKIQKKDTDPVIARKYLGSMGLTSKILYDETTPEVDPLGPENIIIIGVGPLTGTAAPFCGRMEITTKSPLTNHFGSSNTGGDFGAYLKKAGYDAIIIRGVSSKPVYLRINDGQVELRDASHLWGKDTTQTSDEVNQEPSEVKVLSIGPAGENLVRFACAVNEYHHVAGRCGVGAVMGSKKLKAIAVRGTGKVAIARPVEFKQAIKELANSLKATPDVGYMKKSARPMEFSQRVYLDRGCLAGNNFQTGEIPGWEKSRDMNLMPAYVTRLEGVCYVCPFRCFQMGEVNEGKYTGLKVDSVGFISSVLEFGGKLNIDNLPAIWACKKLCHLLGLDYGSASGVIAFAMELYQRGLLTEKDTDGLSLKWGDEDVVLELLHKIAYREGIGDMLADGSLEAAKRIGKDAGNYAMTIKGMEMMWTDPRSAPKAWTLGFLINPRGGDNMKTTHGNSIEVPTPSRGIEKFDMPQDIKDKIYGVSPRVDPDTYDGKAMMVKWMGDMCSAVSAAGGCIFPVTAMGIGSTYFSKLVTAATGWDITPEEFTAIGERIFNLMRLYGVRQGLSRKDDDFPDRFYSEPLPSGPAKGVKLSRKDISDFLDESYSLQGWDSDGIPTGERLIQLGLGEAGSRIGIV